MKVVVCVCHQISLAAPVKRTSQQAIFFAFFICTKYENFDAYRLVKKQPEKLAVLHERVMTLKSSEVQQIIITRVKKYEMV